VAKVAKLAKTWKVGDPLDPRNRLGAMIEKPHLEKVLGYIAAGKAEGAKLVMGGHRILRRSIQQGIAGTHYDDRVLGHQCGKFDALMRSGRLLNGGVLHRITLYVSASCFTPHCVLKNDFNFSAFASKSFEGSCSPRAASNRE
jgi:hypothetical protein